MSIFPDEPVKEERQEELPEDNETPFRPADDAMNDPNDEPERRHDAAVLDDTHQVTDTNLQPEEIYDEGYAGAAEASEPNAGNAVIGYNADNDQRRLPGYDEHSAVAAERRQAMDYGDYISAVRSYDQNMNGDEAEETVQMIVELIAVHMDDVEREEVARGLPGRLQDIMLAVLPSASNVTDDFVAQAMDLQGIDEYEAANRLQAGWQALNDGLSKRRIAIIEAKLPARARRVLEG
jgi:uncharacterized protein (DUF2267 family)